MAVGHILLSFLIVNHYKLDCIIILCCVIMQKEKSLISGCHTVRTHFEIALTLSSFYCFFNLLMDCVLVWISEILIRLILVSKNVFCLRQISHPLGMLYKSKQNIYVLKCHKRLVVING